MIALLLLLGASTTGALFTDAQWGDVQSFLNFIVLVVLVYRQERTPAKTGEKTVNTFKDELDHDQDSDLRGLLVETLLDAMEKRRRTDPPRS